MGQIPGWTGPVTSLPPVNAALSSDPSEPPLGKTPPPVCKLPAVLKVLCTPHKKGSGCGRRHGVVEGDSAMPLLVCTKRHHLPRSGNAHASSPPVLCFYLERIGSKTGSKWIQCLLFYRLHLKGSERCPRAPAGSPQKTRGLARPQGGRVPISRGDAALLAGSKEGEWDSFYGASEQLFRRK